MKRCLCWMLLGLTGVGSALGADPGAGWEAGFDQPPRQARTRCFWWWLNGNVTKAAITRDLEEMKAKGYGGALIFDADGSSQTGHVRAPAGPTFGTPEWRELFLHALREAKRLDLEMGLSPQSGWNLGGPQVTPAESCKLVTLAVTNVTGPGAVSSPLPQPVARQGFYQDVAVLAYPQPKASGNAKWSASSAQKGREAQVVGDGSVESFWVSDGWNAAAGGESLTLTWPAPVSLGRVEITGRAGYGPKSGRVEVSRDGKTFTPVGDFTAEAGRPITATCAAEDVRAARLVFTGAFDARNAGTPRNVQVAEVAWFDGKGARLKTGSGRAPIRDLELKTSQKEAGGSAPDGTGLLVDVPGEPGDVDVKPEDIIDLTDKMGPDGRLTWQPPAGEWEILRLGYTSSGAKVSTASAAWQGLAVDYLDAAVLSNYWGQVIAPLVEAAGPLAGTTWKFLETDSWEVGGANWTARMEAEFLKRRGYALRPFLPVFAGRIVKDRETSNRVLNDLRRTIADCIAENHYTVLQNMAHAHGMAIHAESGGPHAGPFDALQNLGRSDWPMSEFWVPSPHRPREEHRFFVKQAASAAHIYGGRVVCAEGFTSVGPHWNDVWWSSQKPSFDHEACNGLNLTFWHTFTCSPQEQGLPGQEYFAGTHNNPQTTTWPWMGAFIGYLNRCHFLLQEGLFVADVLHYYGDHVPNIARRKEDDPAKVLPGFDYDVCNAEVLLTRASVKDGRIVLPDGMSYRVLSLLDIPILSLDVLRKVHALVKDGATVVGQRPMRTPGLSGFPESEVELKRLADELWGDTDGKSVTEHRFGKGRVVWGKSAREVLVADGVAPDFEAAGMADGSRVDYIHRTKDGADVYFVANLQPRPESFRAAFRVSGRVPELWDPVTGKRMDAPSFGFEAGRTLVPLELPASGSVFVVFRRAASGPVAARPVAAPEVTPVPGPWRVTFDPKWGGPESADFPALVSWTEREEPGIRHYSGAAVYRTEFSAEPGKGKLFLAIGEPGTVASVKVNGKECGTVWAPPFEADITEAVKSGKNTLEITVVNSWFNRVNYDQTLPESQRLTRTNIRIKPGKAPERSGLFGPVQVVRR